MRPIFLIIGFLWTDAATAGPWLRTAGERFLSLSLEVPVDDGRAYGSAYYEYGFHERLTLGFDLGADEEDLYKAIGFAKLPLSWPNGPNKIALEMGVGVTDDEAVFRPGVSFGRGIAWQDIPGWVSIDTLAHLGIENGYTNVTTDVTLGVNVSERSKVILQLQSGHHLMDPDYVKLAPSYVYERQPGQHIEFGMLTGVSDSDAFALKLGMWRSF